ncbi:MAG: O-antigen ligase family protein [Bacteroidetes bacterium]|nr:O-antigen ligase family protein [Bacteroidota bacterium]
MKELEERPNLILMLSIVVTLPLSTAIFNVSVTIFLINLLVQLTRGKRSGYTFHRDSFWIILPILFLFCLYSISLFYSNNKSSGLIIIERLSPLLVIGLYFCFIKFTNDEKKFLLFGFVSGNILSLIFNLSRALIKSINYTDNKIFFDASVLRGQEFWYSIDQGGNYFFYKELSYFIDPIYWSVYLLFSFSIVASLLFLLDGKIKYISLTILSFMLLIAIFLCSSRIILFCLIPITLVFALRYVKKRITLAMVIILGASLILTVGNPRLKRFSTINGIVTSNQNRLDIWQSSWEVFCNSPIIGNGLGESEDILFRAYISHGHPEYATIQLNEHNQFLQIASSIGIVGLIPFLYIIIYSFKKSMLNNDLIQFTFIFSFLLIGFVENFLVRRAGVIYFVFFFCLLYTSDKPNKKIA